jgi:hypothetical protein
VIGWFDAQLKGTTQNQNSLCRNGSYFAKRAFSGLKLDFCKLSIQTAECPVCKNCNPCGTGVFDFCKPAIGGSIAGLQNFS